MSTGHRTTRCLKQSQLPPPRRALGDRPSIQDTANDPGLPRNIRPLTPVCSVNAEATTLAARLRSKDHQWRWHFYSGPFRWHQMIILNIIIAVLQCLPKGWRVWLYAFMQLLLFQDVILPQGAAVSWGQQFWQTFGVICGFAYVAFCARRWH